MLSDADRDWIEGIKVLLNSCHAGPWSHHREESDAMMRAGERGTFGREIYSLHDGDMVAVARIRAVDGYETAMSRANSILLSEAREAMPRLIGIIEAQQEQMEALMVRLSESEHKRRRGE